MHSLSIKYSGLLLLALSTFIPTPVAAQIQRLQITVTSVKGMVQVRPAEGRPWLAVQRGIVLGMGAELRTGPRSLVRFVIPPSEVFMLDRLGTIKVLTAIEQARGKRKTDLGMKYGRIRYQIQAAGIEHSTSILSTGSNITIRGSDVVFNNDALGVWTYGNGMLTFNDMVNRQAVEFGRLATARVSQGFASVGAYARRRTIDADPRSSFSARTKSEEETLEQYLAAGGIDNQNFRVDKSIFLNGEFSGL